MANIPVGVLVIVAEHGKRQAVLISSSVAEHYLKYSKNSCVVLAIAISMVSA